MFHICKPASCISGIDVYTVKARSVRALYSPLHGGANEVMLKMFSKVGTVENTLEFIEGVKDKKGKMSGFEHRVFKNCDNRVKVIKKLAEEVFSIISWNSLIEALMVNDTTIPVSHVTWSLDGDFITVAFSKHLIHLYAYPGSNDLIQRLEVS